MARAIALLAALALLLLSAAAAALALAGIYREDAQVVADSWYYVEDEAGLPPGAWQQVRRYLWLAERLAPFDAEALSDLGALYEARVMATAAGMPVDTGGASGDYRTALDYYRRALALQPTSAMAWGNIALLKVSGGDIDAEFARAARNALALAPWEAAVQSSIAGGGLTVWDRLPGELQADIEQAVLRGVASRSRLMGFTVERFGLVEPGDALATGD